MNMQKNRRHSKTLSLGGVLIGGDNPITIQSMTNTKTADIPGTLKQIEDLAGSGCEIARLAVPDLDSAKALGELVRKSPLPLVADIHFDYRLALVALEMGIAGLRLNPGNIGNKERVSLVAKEADARNVPIRIGVNGGSLEKELLQKYGAVTPQAMVESALNHVRILEECNFDKIKISLKSSSLPVTIEAYRLMAGQVDYPLHIGLTEAGSEKRGSIRSAIAIGTLLEEGIGDTIRVSLTGDPVKEVWAAREILKALGLREEGFEFISCPTCGRTSIDVERIAMLVESSLEKIKPPYPMKIAVMGCAVNGPGEARDADCGIAGGKNEGLLFSRGEVCGKYPNNQLAQALIDKVMEMINKNDCLK